jgi:hypothetical protein
LFQQEYCIKIQDLSFAELKSRHTPKLYASLTSNRGNPQTIIDNYACQNSRFLRRDFHRFRDAVELADEHGAQEESCNPWCIWLYWSGVDEAPQWASWS